MKIWWYKCDLDPIEEGVQIERSSESETDKDYKEHLEKLHDFLCEWIEQNLNDDNSETPQSGKITLKSLREKRSNTNGINGNCRSFFK